MISVASLSPCFISVCISLITFTLHASHFPHLRHLWSTVCLLGKHKYQRSTALLSMKKPKLEEVVICPDPWSVETGQDLYFLAQKTVLFPSNVQVGIRSLPRLCSSQGWTAKPAPAAPYPGKQPPIVNILICRIDCKTCPNTYQVLTDLCSNSTCLIPERVNCCCPWC